MGQSTSAPSCIPSFNVPQKKLTSTDYPDSMSMQSPRRMNPSRTLASVQTSSGTPYSPAASSSGYTMAPSPMHKPRLGLKALTVDEHESPATTARSLVGWLKRSKKPEYMLETPKGEAKQEFKHFCPICYRYFRSIYSTSCCAGNCCHDCAVNFIATRGSSVKFTANVELPLPCPNCNQTDGVAFVALSQADESKHYIESPRTQALLEQSQARRQEQFHFMEQHSQQIYA